MSLELVGRIENKLPLQSGVSSRGEWRKQEFIIETQEQYPKKVCISCWGDKIDELEQIQEGESIKVSINIESREYNGRWYTDIKAWRIEKNSNGQGNASPEPTAPPLEIPDEDDVLPF